MSRRPTILYISYDGMLEPLGQSQVVAYLERLAPGFGIQLVSFEKPADRADRPRVAAVAARLAAAGIAWHPLRYHKSPTLPATGYDIARGIACGLALAVRHRAAIVHARSFVAGLIGRAIAAATGARLLLDMRGFWAQERVDGGLWPEGGRLFRIASRIERRSIAAADHVVTLTEASRPVIAGMAAGWPLPPVTMIPTCADLDRFVPAETPAPGAFTLGYVGSIGTWYLFEETVRLFAALRRLRPDARLLVVNRSETARVGAIAAAAGVAEATSVVTADHGDVPPLVRRMHAGAALVRPLPSKRASAPTKLAEYLGCGVPCIANAGIGDVEAVLEGEGVGVVVRAFTDGALGDAAARLLALCAAPDIAARCRAAALRHYALDDGVARYRAVYESLLA